MPQDSLRSVVYRSFVTCDDPKGVAECKTVRKSTKMEPKFKNQMTQQQSCNNTSTQQHDNKGLQNLSSFQIMEVSRGAHKLNQVIDSLSNNTSFDKHYIANDLLKGALDLQESLAILGKLQEASHYITKPKKKPVGGRLTDVGTEFMDFEKPKISGDGSSRDCYDELSEVIRESFARQNMLPKEKDYGRDRKSLNVSMDFSSSSSSQSREKDYTDRRNLDLCMDLPSSSSSLSKEKDYADIRNFDLSKDFPSSSSSQSSLIRSCSREFSPSKVQLENPKATNYLIARLMGLDEVPQKADISKEKLSNQRSHLLDIDLPRPRKPQCMVQKAVRERRELEEMIETMQFKGLVSERKSGDGKYQYDVSLLRKSLSVEGPPIVIMRPVRVPDLQAEEFHEGKPVKRRQMPRKISEEFLNNAPQVPKGRPKFTETDEKLRAAKTPKQKLNKDKEVKVHFGESPAKPVKKTVDIQHKLSTKKINDSKPLVPREQKKEAIVKKIAAIPNLASNTRKQAGIKDAKCQASAKTQDQGKITTLKISRTARDSNVSKCRIARGKTATPEKQMKPTSLSSIPKKNLQEAKLDSKPSAALVENIQTDGSFPINIESNIQDSMMKSTTTSEKIIEEVMNSCYVSTSDNSRNATSSPCEFSRPINKNAMKYIEDGTCIPGRNLEEMKSCESIYNTRYLLLSSAFFLSRAEELFDVGTCDTKVLPTASLHDSEMPDGSLLLECATEILERKSLLPCTWTIKPSSQNLLKKPKCRSSLQQLIGEISDAIEVLRNYNKSCGGAVHVDSIYSMLERDLWWNEEVTGAWDLGWRNGNTKENVSGVVHDVGKLVLNEIISDVVMEFMFQ